MLRVVLNCGSNDIELRGGFADSLQLDGKTCCATLDMVIPTHRLSELILAFDKGHNQSTVSFLAFLP